MTEGEAFDTVVSLWLEASGFPVGILQVPRVVSDDWKPEDVWLPKDRFLNPDPQRYYDKVSDLEVWCGPRERMLTHVAGRALRSGLRILYLKAVELARVDLYKRSSESRLDAILGVPILVVDQYGDAFRDSAGYGAATFKHVIDERLERRHMTVVMGDSPFEFRGRRYG